MTYATDADIASLYGPDLVAAIADRDGDGVADAGVIARALEEAAGEIDLWLAERYSLPLAEVPTPLRRIAVDVAVYRMAADGAALTDEMRTRYEDAVKTLRAIAKGEARLSFTPDPNADPADPLAGQGPRPIVTSGPPRLFSRDKTRGL